MKEKELTILLPCLNEELTLEQCLKKIDKHLLDNKINAEILVSDNGSTDLSLSIAKKHKIRVVTANKKGYGNALIEGIKNIETKYILMADSDNTYEFNHISIFLNTIKENDLDLLVGNRFLGKLEKGAMPFYSRYFGNPFLSKLGNVFFKTNINDFHCGMRIFKTESIKRLCLTSSGMEFASEMICKAKINNLKTEEMATTLLKPIKERKPHLRPIRDGLRHIKLMIKIYINKNEYIIGGNI